MNDEIEMLQSIYTIDELKVEEMKDSASILNFILSDLITLRIFLPVNYPHESPPIVEFVNTLFSDDQKVQLCDELKEIWRKSDHQVCVYEWIESIRQKYIDHVIEEQKSSISTGTAQQQQEEPPRNIITMNLPPIYHGQPLTDRKSTFQAHVAAITSPDLIQPIMDCLLSDRKINRATHNIMAYRIVQDQTIYQDHDDDGEHAAGNQLKRLLNLTNAQNVIVVVSRWYGGIHLGPDRFKHIMHVARTVLVDNQLI